MDLKLVKKLLDLISESNADEVTVEEGEFKLKVKKNSDAGIPAQYQMPQYPVQPAAAPAQSAPAPQPDNSDAGNPGSSSDDNPGGELVKSPIVGTFYKSPSPDSDPFVQTGDRVEAGQTLCIIEAMKIMNEIEAEFSGTVEKILIEDGTPVEFDQPLFIIKKG